MAIWTGNNSKDLDLTPGVSLAVFLEPRLGFHEAMCVSSASDEKGKNVFNMKIQKHDWENKTTITYVQ